MMTVRSMAIRFPLSVPVTTLAGNLVRYNLLQVKHLSNTWAFKSTLIDVANHSQLYTITVGTFNIEIILFLKRLCEPYQLMRTSRLDDVNIRSSPGNGPSNIVPAIGGVLSTRIGWLAVPTVLKSTISNIKH